MLSPKEKMQLIEQIKDVIGRDQYEKWMNKKIISLGDKTPLEVLETPDGKMKINRILNAIEHGIPF